jgi:uncharacterized protein YndB with AHSA1/START domain
MTEETDMTKRSTEHATFVIERTYDAAPDRVFAAWTTADAKGRWFGPGEEHRLDFRVGGSEHLRVRVEGDEYTYDGLYRDIVDGQRIVYSYEMQRNGERISVSVATVELASAEAGTLLRFTEQGVFLDGHDRPDLREHGTGELLDKLALALGEQVQAA